MDLEWQVILRKFHHLIFANASKASFGEREKYCSCAGWYPVIGDKLHSNINAPGLDPKNKILGLKPI